MFKTTLDNCFITHERLDSYEKYRTIHEVFKDLATQVYKHKPPRQISNEKFAQMQAIVKNSYLFLCWVDNYSVGRAEEQDAQGNWINESDSHEEDVPTFELNALIATHLKGLGIEVSQTQGSLFERLESYVKRHNATECSYGTHWINEYYGNSTTLAYLRIPNHRLEAAFS